MTILKNIIKVSLLFLNMPIPRREKPIGKEFLTSKQDDSFSIPENTKEKLESKISEEYDGRYGDIEMNKESFDFLKELEKQVGKEFIVGDIIINKIVINEYGELLELDLERADISELPKLPSDLKLFNCSKTSIDVLPKLPNTLEVLYCNKTSIRELPELPAGLQVLGCSETSIRELPALPDRLRELDCSDTSIVALPELPSALEYLVFSNTFISELPELPSGLENLYCKNTPFSNNKKNEQQLTKYCWEHNIFLYI